MNVLLSSDPAAVTNWTEQFERARIPFYVVGLLIILNLTILPVIMAVDPWSGFESRVFLLAALTIAYGAGLATSSRRIQAGVTLFNFALVFVSFLPTGRS